ncbi:MAG: hypothetical protein IJ353_04665 [Lachnospiraceae bacterium]|nr:hypothetical protein [Lachnospiraceae bacterium]
MGVLLFLIFVIGFSWVAEEFVKKMREEQREIDSLRSEDEKYNSRLGSSFGGRAYELFKRKK